MKNEKYFFCYKINRRIFFAFYVWWSTHRKKTMKPPKPTSAESLHRWFPVKHTSKAQTIVPDILYLHCSHNRMVDAKWYFSSTFHYPMLTKHTIVANIHGRKGTPMSITVACGEIPKDEEKTPVQECRLSSMHKNAKRVPFLKSHLQKTIRKGLTGLAVRTCKELMQQDVLQVVRRLSIIMVEDVELHPAFNILLWWTIMLSKQVSENKLQGGGEVLQTDDVPLCLLEWLLGLTHILCECKHRVRFDSTPKHLPTLWQSVQQIHTKQHTSVSQMHNTLWSVMLRASYGGLKGDVALLCAVMNAYLQQSDTSKQSPFWNTPVRPIVYRTVEPLEIHTWDLDAIDFHIARHILSKMEEWVADERVDVKRMMWENGSSRNVRDDTMSSNRVYKSDVWKAIIPRVRQWQSYMLRQ